MPGIPGFFSLIQTGVQALDIKEIVEKDFTKSLIGYNCKEVDAFLDDVIEQMESYEKNQKEMLTALDYLLNELEKFESEDKTSKKDKQDSKNVIRQKVKNTADTIRKNIVTSSKADFTVPVYTDAASAEQNVKKDDNQDKKENSAEQKKEDVKPVKTEENKLPDNTKTAEAVKVSKTENAEPAMEKPKEIEVETEAHVPEPGFLKIKNTVSGAKKTAKDVILEDTYMELEKELIQEKEQEQ